MRTEYRRRRDVLVEALGDALPEATIHGIAAGLHATVELPDDYDERAILEEARARRIDLTTMRDFWIEPGTRAPTLLVGYGQVPEAAINTAVSELAEAVRAARQTTPPSRR
jgi:GntR family transcriptional regulator / MocR family aminotransferase